MSSDIVSKSPLMRLMLVFPGRHWRLEVSEGPVLSGPVQQPGSHDTWPRPHPAKHCDETVTWLMWGPDWFFSMYTPTWGDQVLMLALPPLVVTGRAAPMEILLRHRCSTIIDQQKRFRIIQIHIKISVSNNDWFSNPNFLFRVTGVEPIPGVIR